MSCLVKGTRVILLHVFQYKDGSEKRVPANLLREDEANMEDANLPSGTLETSMPKKKLRLSRSFKGKSSERVYIKVSSA